LPSIKYFQNNITNTHSKWKKVAHKIFISLFVDSKLKNFFLTIYKSRKKGAKWKTALNDDGDG